MQPTISLTFDDGLLVQREYAVPELNRRGLRGTFFLIQNSECNDGNFVPFWKRAAKAGHEIGSHTVNHKKAASLNPAEMAHETISSRLFLTHAFDTPVNSFCYPYTDAPSLLQGAVAYAGYKQARGGRVARGDKYLVPGDGANLLNTPCFHAGPETIKDAPNWIAETIRRKAWLTLMFHGVGPDHMQWDNISTFDFCTFLNALVAASGNGLAVLPYGEAADAYRRG